MIIKTKKQFLDTRRAFNMPVIHETYGIEHSTWELYDLTRKNSPVKMAGVRRMPPEHGSYGSFYYECRYDSMRQKYIRWQLEYESYFD